MSFFVGTRKELANALNISISGVIYRLKKGKILAEQLGDAVYVFSDKDISLLDEHDINEAFDEYQYWEGSAIELCSLLERDWWYERKKIIDEESRLIDVDITEYLPHEIRNQLLGSVPDTFDKDNWSVFELKAGLDKLQKDKISEWRGEQGKDYLIRINKKFKEKMIKKYPKTLKGQLVTIKHLSADPNGQSLPEGCDLQTLPKNKERREPYQHYGLSQGGSGALPTIYYCRLIGNPSFRILWINDMQKKKTEIIDFYHKQNAPPCLKSGGYS